MAQVEFVNFSFTYPRVNKKALNKINFKVNEGELVLICGPSSSGKSTLLHQLKGEIAHAGIRSGEIFYKGRDISTLDPYIQASEIGMVFQEPDAQIVTNRVINELAFSMENLNYSLASMGRRIGEIVQFFGLGDKLYEDIHNLSGGQKQLINLASVLLLQPKLLLLDEPTSQLDPIAARDFLQMIQSLNRDYSITVLISEHRLDEIYPIADKVVVLDQGEIKYKGSPRKVAKEIYDKKDKEFFNYIPDLGKLYLNLDRHKDHIPFTVREAKTWINSLDLENFNISRAKNTKPKEAKDQASILKAKNISFRYEREGPLVLDKLNLNVLDGEVLSILGGNGSGKSTLLKILAGGYKPQYGKVYFKGKDLFKIPEKDRYRYLGYLDQNPILYFLHESVEEEIYTRAREVAAKDEDVEDLIGLFKLKNVLKRHPYDISGGEKQKLALALILLAKPKILLLDEPTKGVDPVAKNEIGNFLLKLREEGMSIVMATHDMEFAARFSNRVGLVFDGDIKALEEPRKFFNENFFYTTIVNRILRDKVAGAVLYEDVVNDGYF